MALIEVNEYAAKRSLELAFLGQPPPPSLSGGLNTRNVCRLKKRSGGCLPAQKKERRIGGKFLSNLHALLPLLSAASSQLELRDNPGCGLCTP
jgi:hypothetical protein